MHTADNFTARLNSSILSTKLKLEAAEKSTYLNTYSCFSVDALQENLVRKQIMLMLKGYAKRIAEMGDDAIVEMINEKAVDSLRTLINSQRKASDMNGSYGHQFEARCQTQFDKYVYILFKPYLTEEDKAAVTQLGIIMPNW